MRNIMQGGGRMREVKQRTCVFNSQSTEKNSISIKNQLVDECQIRDNKKLRDERNLEKNSNLNFIVDSNQLMRQGHFHLPFSHSFYVDMLPSSSLSSLSSGYLRFTSTSLLVFSLSFSSPFLHHNLFCVFPIRKK